MKIAKNTRNFELRSELAKSKVVDLTVLYSRGEVNTPIRIRIT